MIKNSQTFIEAFVQIEMYLKRYLDSPKVGFTQMVHMASKTNPIVKKHVADLIEYSQLRNAIVHNRAGEEVAIAEPHDQVCIDISNIANSLTKPKRILSLVKHQNVFVSNLSKSLEDLLKEQGTNNYSVVPIYDKGIYVGLVHPRSYQKLLESLSANVINLKELTVKDILKAYPDDERVVFYPSTASIAEIMEKFVDHHDKGRGIIAVLITQNGKPNEKLIGVLTSADLPRMVSALE